jgi:hypothetical protein
LGFNLRDTASPEAASSFLRMPPNILFSRSCGLAIGRRDNAALGEAAKPSGSDDQREQQHNIFICRPTA